MVNSMYYTFDLNTIWDEKREDVIYLDGYIYEIKNSDLRELFKIPHDKLGDVILENYRTHGKRTLDDVNGEFSLIILDTSSKEIILYRDKAGVSPLFYSYERGVLTVSSSTSMFFHKSKEYKIDRAAIAVRNRLGFYPENRTFLRGIYSVRPGTLMRFSLQHSPKTEFLTDVVALYYNNNKGDHGSKNYLNELEDALARALRMRLLSGLRERKRVPIAYSGGMDSTLLLILAKIMNLPVQPVFLSSDPTNPDKDIAIHNADALDYELYLINKSPIDFFESLDDMVTYLEAGRGWAAYHLSSGIGKNNNLSHYAICGEGSDELFFGYAALRNPEIEFLKIKDYLENVNKIFNEKFEFHAREDIQKAVHSHYLTEAFATSHTLNFNAGGFPFGAHYHFPYMDENVVKVAGMIPYNMKANHNLGKLIVRKLLQKLTKELDVSIKILELKNTFPRSMSSNAQLLEAYAYHLIPYKVRKDHPFGYLGLPTTDILLLEMWNNKFRDSCRCEEI